ncbi:hypothetical protein MP228_010854 [Amoeboaphelidium protococcarum]|nr:hypothetical protein MP228_010854 [Amoeboaphelidium protococcarum]
MADSNSSTKQTSMFQPPESSLNHENKRHLLNMEQYQSMYRESVQQPEQFWSRLAMDNLSWIKPFGKVFEGSFADGQVKWFSDGELNVCYNCVDRHAQRDPSQIAIIWDQDQPGQSVKITYGELLDQVCQLANALKSLGVKKRDVVAIYMPMVPEAVYAMLACARIGAIHNVVFAGFSCDALRDRINDAGCKVLLTADIGRRGGKKIQLKQIVDEALYECPSVQKVLLFCHSGDDQALKAQFTAGRDVFWQEFVGKQSKQCVAEPMNAEDPLFILYTSGSTGKPKGIIHTQAGYLLGAMTTLKYTFDLHPASAGDVFACVADVGWITGHSYIVYGPLSNGCTTVLFESIPTYPTPSRYWQLIDEHKVTHFYTSPTAIRALKRLGDQHVASAQLSSLRVIGSVGEPISPETWMWVHSVVGRGRCAIVDTYWQTETGSFIIAPYASVTSTKPGSATYPQFGIKPVVLDPTNGHVLQRMDGTDDEVTGVLCLSQPWPSMARSIWQDHDRFKQTYFSAYKGYYFTGDGVSVDKDGYYWIKGRVDDVINVSGHRLSTAEIESALVLYSGCSEAAVVGVPDDITGQSILCFTIIKAEMLAQKDEQIIQKELIAQVRHHIGPFATPKRILIVNDLPKTRSGKIMRRILRKIASHEEDQLGDLSTLADPSVIDSLITKIKQLT